MPLAADKERLVRHAQQEWRVADQQKLIFPLHVDVQSAMSLIANLQLALRHPGNNGISAEVARRTIDGLIGMMAQCGLEATAAIARLGDDPGFDEPAPR
jgi:hypothetical protein